MRSAAHGLPPYLAFDLRAVSLAEGVRAGLAIASVVALHEWLNWPGLMETALAAQLTCLCDAGGALRRRLVALLSFGVTGAVLTALFLALRPVSDVAIVALAGLAIFACAFARAFGQTAMQVGNLLTVVVALALRAGAPPPSQALAVGATFLGGSLWATLLTLLIWRLNPLRPARSAIADALRDLAGLAVDMRETAAAEGDETRWDFHARQHRRQVRESLERARTAVLETLRQRGVASPQAGQAWLRLEAADQVFGALIALSDVLAGHLSPAARASADRLMRLVPPVLRLVAREVAADSPRMRGTLDRAIAAIAAVGRGADDPRLERLAAQISERLRATLSPVAGPDRLPLVRGPSWRDVILGNIRGDADVLRHALRVAATSLPAFALQLAFPTNYLHWFTITLVLTLQPYVALTAVKAAERVGGTVLGGFLAAAIGLVCTTPMATAAALFPLAVAALAVRAVSFGLFMAVLTPEVVLLSGLGQPGQDELRIAVLRAVFTLAGGVAALLSAYALWPSWEPSRLHAQMRRLIAAHGRYATAVIDGRLGRAAEVETARRAAGAASNDFEASLQRVLLERRLGGAREQQLQGMLTIDAAMRRLAGRLAALEATREGPEDEAAWRAMRDWIEAATARLAREETPIPPRPGVAEAAAADGPLARLARPIELTAGALRRIAA